jgi:hypothetical protein
MHAGREGASSRARSRRRGSQSPSPSATRNVSARTLQVYAGNLDFQFNDTELVWEADERKTGESSRSCGMSSRSSRAWESILKENDAAVGAYSSLIRRRRRGRKGPPCHWPHSCRISCNSTSGTPAASQLVAKKYYLQHTSIILHIQTIFRKSRRSPTSRSLPQRPWKLTEKQI